MFSSASYALDVFSDVLSQKERDEHFTKVAGFYFKKLIGISIYSRTHKILHFLFKNDFWAYKTVVLRTGEKEVFFTAMVFIMFYVIKSAVTNLRTMRHVVASTAVV